MQSHDPREGLGGPRAVQPVTAEMPSGRRARAQTPLGHSTSAPVTNPICHPHLSPQPESRAMLLRAWTQQRCAGQSRSGQATLPSPQPPSASHSPLLLLQVQRSGRDSTFPLQPLVGGQLRCSDRTTLGSVGPPAVLGRPRASGAPSCCSEPIPGTAGNQVGPQALLQPDASLRSQSL